MFAYSLYMMYLDLDELDTVFKKRLFWSVDKPNIAWFRRKDYLRPVHMSLKETVHEKIHQDSGIVHEGPVRILTHLRYFGYIFNPVSFYYCYNREDTSVETIIADITNTPWNERYAYVLGETLNETKNGRKRYRFTKQFHVSPFMDMNFAYDWRFNTPGNSLNIHMINLKDDELFFDATLTLKRLEISSATLIRVLLRYPLMTFKVSTLIYWQALRLRLKRIPFYTHPDKIQKEN
jgi:DUF1365 family protein